MQLMQFSAALCAIQYTVLYDIYLSRAVRAFYLAIFFKYKFLIISTYKELVLIRQFYFYALQASAGFLKLFMDFFFLLNRVKYGINFVCRTTCFNSGLRHFESQLLSSRNFLIKYEKKNECRFRSCLMRSSSICHIL